jgi:hypothetical protein
VAKSDQSLARRNASPVLHNQKRGPLATGRDQRIEVLATDRCITERTSRLEQPHLDGHHDRQRGPLMAGAILAGRWVVLQTGSSTM